MASFSWQGNCQVGPGQTQTTAVIYKVAFNLLPFSICQQVSHLVYVKLRKWGLGLARRHRWPQPPGSGREGRGDGLSHPGALCKGANQHLPLKGCLLQGPECYLPTNKILSTGELPRLGFQERAIMGMAPGSCSGHISRL